MRSILSLFSKSPFAPLKSHMEIVASCVHLVPHVFRAMQENPEEFELLVQKISELEHKADILKNDIRNHLPKGMILAMNRENLLNILRKQDNIADCAEDIAVLCSIKPLKILDIFKEEFHLYLEKNIETFDKAFSIMQEIQELLEFSFGGIEAEKVKYLIDEVAFKEHEADVLQSKLLKKIYQAEGEMSYATFYLWQKVLEAISGISNLSESLANQVRMTLEQ